MTDIKTDLSVKATASLQRQIEEELLIPNPDIQTAKAILQDDQDADELLRGRSSGDNKPNC